MSAPEPGGTGASGGASLWWLGIYDKYLRRASYTSSSRSTTWSTRPVISACRRQPPRSSALTFSPSAIDTRRGLDTAMVALLCITEKSARHISHVDEPNE